MFDVRFVTAGTAPDGDVAELREGSSTDFRAVSTLGPGNSYWVKVSNDGRLNVGPVQRSAQADASSTVGPSIKASPQDEGPRLLISDEDGHRADLRLSRSFSSESIQRVVMPPVPMASFFDVRFANGVQIASLAHTRTHIVEIQGTSGTPTIKARGLTEGQLLHVSNADRGAPG